MTKSQKNSVTERSEPQQREQPLKVGFDFDGVILYNPARVLRPFLSYLRGQKVKNGEEKLVFYHPEEPLKQAFWWLAHQSSLFPAKGLQDIYDLSQKGLLEGHIVTGRSSFLKPDFERRLRSIQADRHMRSWHISDSNEQPHEFKEKMINKLGLDCYVEDNWNIARYLAKRTNARVFWISNAADFHFDFPDKYLHLHQVVAKLKELV